MPRGLLVGLTLLWLPASLPGQHGVTIRVNAAETSGALKPVWNYFGYDEPNYTYMKNGRKLVAELGALSPVPVYIRTHNLLTTGDGTPALKWGSTNAYTEDSSGKPIYDWKIVDQIFDTYIQAKAKPFVEIGFMPEALSTHPQPYRHNWPRGPLSTGWAYPPKDYSKWAELIRQWVLHSVQRYGWKEVESWEWEVWNEPDISYWRGSADEYNKLYDFTADAAKRALPTARVGGPASTGPANAKAAAFLRQFLEHCAHGRNYVTGQTGAPLDFITYHAKGRLDLVENHVRMGIARNLQDLEKGFEIIAAFPKFRSLPIILSESDPEGCAACSARLHPENAYRNGPLYPSYTAVALNNILKLADRNHSNLQGVLTWAFEFEDQPYFEGLRTLATNGIDKPILNLFRLCGLMGGAQVKVESSGALGLDAIVNHGVKQQPDVDALAVVSDHQLSILAWNYHDDDVPAAAAEIALSVNGLPGAARRLLLQHYGIDQDHSNAFTVWKELGSPQSPTPQQYARLEAAGQLQLLESPRWVSSDAGRLDVSFMLPRQGVSLIQLSW